MLGSPPITVLMRDPTCAGALQASSSVRLLKRPAASAAARHTNVFVLVRASELGEVAAFVREVNRRHQLRGLLVHADVELRWLIHLLDRADLRTLRNTLVHRSPDVPRRVLTAWRQGAQDELIADATVISDRLVVLSCALDRHDVRFEDIAALASLPEAERTQFEISSDGSYLHWPDSDVHLDIEAIRVATDPRFGEQCRNEKLRHDERFGTAVARLRKRHGLTPADIKGVSTRQLRRIEAGEFFPRTATLEKLATAHGMKLTRYVDAVAGQMQAAD